MLYIYRKLYLKVFKNLALYILILGFTVSRTDAQQMSVFQSFTSKDGLPSDFVFDICTDQNGYLWLGTDKGLVKYDGFTWKLMTTENGLPGNYINKIFAAGKDGLWIVVSAKGIYHYHTTTGASRFVTDDFMHHHLQTNNEGDLFFYNDRFNHPNEITRGIMVEPVHLHKTLVFEDHHRKPHGKATFIDFAHKKLMVLPLKNIHSNNAVDFTLPNTWTTESLNEPVEEQLLFEKIDAHVYKNKTSIYFFLPGKAALKIPLFPIENEYLNAIRTPDGVMVWNEKDGLFDVKENGSIKHYTKKDGLTHSIITAVHPLQAGSYMLATLGGGLLYLLPSGNARIDTDDKPVKGLALNDQIIYALLDDKLITLDITHPESVSTYPINDKDVQHIQVYGNEIIISTLGGFSIYKIQNNQLISQHRIKNGAGISTVIKRGTQYITGTYGTHITTYRNLFEKGQIDKLTPAINEGLIPIQNGFVTYNFEDGLRFIYHDGTQQTLSIREGLLSNAVFHVHQHQDSFWISTSKGLCIFSANKIVKQYDRAAGIQGNKCLFSFHDNTGQFWLITDQYLHAFNGSRFIAISSAPIIEGLTDQARAFVYHAPTNTLITGSLKRIFLTKLNTLVNQQAAIPSTFENIRSFQRQINTRTSFTLPIQHRFIDFSFKPFSVNPFSKATLYYKLVGQDEHYSTLRDSLTVRYANLRSGQYTLMTKTVNSDGLESEAAVLATFSVDKPYWEKGWFIALALLGGAGIISAIVVYLSKRREKKQLEKRSIEMQLNKERERISKDLHDHLGTSLVTMIAQTDNIETKLMNHQTAEALEKVKQLSTQSRDTVNVLRETIWAVQENSHTLYEFEMRVRSFLQRVLTPQGIDWIVELQGSGEQRLTANQSLQLFRIIQEATQNIIKHAEATSAMFQFIVEARELQIRIQDNGKGMALTEGYLGNGLTNMRQRIQDIQGKISFRNNNGCMVEFSTHLT